MLWGVSHNLALSYLRMHCPSTAHPTSPHAPVPSTTHPTFLRILPSPWPTHTVVLCCSVCPEQWCLCMTLSLRSRYFLCLECASTVCCLTDPYLSLEVLPKGHLLPEALPAGLFASVACGPSACSSALCPNRRFQRLSSSLTQGLGRAQICSVSCKVSC